MKRRDVIWWKVSAHQHLWNNFDSKWNFMQVTTSSTLSPDNKIGTILCKVKATFSKAAFPIFQNKEIMLCF